MGLPQSARPCVLAGAAAAVVTLTLVFCAHAGVPFGPQHDVVASALHDAAAAAAAAGRAPPPEKGQHETCAVCVARRCVIHSSTAEKAAPDWLRLPPADREKMAAHPHPHAVGVRTHSPLGNHTHHPPAHLHAGVRHAAGQPLIDDDVVVMGVATDTAAGRAGQLPAGADSALAAGPGQSHHAGVGVHPHGGVATHHAGVAPHHTGVQSAAHAGVHPAAHAGAHPAAHVGAHPGHPGEHAGAHAHPGGGARAAPLAPPAVDTCSASFDAPEVGGADHYYCQCKCCHAPCGQSRFCSTHSPSAPLVGVQAAGADGGGGGGAPHGGGGAARHAPPVGNPCVGMEGVLTEAYKLLDLRDLPATAAAAADGVDAAAGAACVQTCLPVSAKNSAARAGLVFGQGWCANAGYAAFYREVALPAAAVGQPPIAAFVYTAGAAPAPAAGAQAHSAPRSAAPPGTRSGGGAAAPAPSAQPAGGDFAAAVAFAPPPSPAANPCAPFAAAEPSQHIMLDATKLSGKLCTQVCLPAKLEATGKARGVVGGRGTCAAQGFPTLVSSGANGNVPWFISTVADAAAGHV